MRTRVICIAIAVVWLPFYSFAQWIQTNGSFGGDIQCFAVSGTNVYAGGRWGGVFLSTDNGTNWTAINTGLTNTAVLALALSGTNLFALTHLNHVFRSSNNGANWTEVASGISPHPLVALASAGTNLYVTTASAGGVFVSTDNGTTWNPASTALSDFSQMVELGTNLFAVTWNNGVFLSTNNGTSWAPVNNGLAATNF